jgi:hypothetical protein
MISKITTLLILSSLILSAASCGTAKAGTELAIEPATSSLAVNETVSVSVNITGVANLTAIEIHLSFDPNILEVVEMTNGGFLQADFVVQNTFDNAAGTVDYAIAQMTQPPVSGTGMLLTIVFRAKAPGSSPVRFRETNAAPQGALLSDPNGKAIQVSLVNSNLNIK